jgi:hypothetical protein
MKQRLIILSDLWGKYNAEWVKTYEEILKPFYEIQFYDCCELGEVNTSDFSEGKLHEQFINGGIETAVDQLIHLENSKVDVLAFSIGGTIAWKSALKGLVVGNLFAVSSTRLRYELEEPNCEIRLFFGEKDSNKPNEDWFNKSRIDYEIIQGKGHNMYSEYYFTKKICEAILSKIKGSA